jgi:tripartite-type tricarboxylate transporter receptor subunit TctC
MLMRSTISLLVLISGIAVAQAAEPVSFAGKTITMIIGSAPGGGTDTTGRLMANFLSSHLLGKPSVVVRNIPGAQGMTSMNYFAKQVAPDGLTLTMGAQIQADPPFFRSPQSQYDPTKFPVIGGAGRGGSVLIINKEAEKRLYDKSAAPVVMGSLGGIPRAAMQMTAWGIEYLGWNSKWVVGYPGTNDLTVALQRGEVDMTATSNLYLIQQLIGSGQFKILAQSGQPQNGQFVGRPDFGDSPLISNLLAGKLATPIEHQAFDYWASSTALDKWVALPPKAPEPYVMAYRTAYKAAFTDPEFAEMGKKISEDFEPMAWEDVTALMEKIGATSPQALAFMNGMLRKQGLQGE